MRRAFAVALFLCLALPLAAQSGTTVYIVRHAEKAAAPANDPPLTAEGTARAIALKDALAGAGITAVISTPTIRTRTTAVPLAESLGLTIETMAVQGTIAAHGAQVAAAVKAKAGQSVLVVGHSNTINVIATALGGPRIDALCDGEYDQIFVLHLQDNAPPRFARLKFGAPSLERGCAEMKQP
jgi:broad specificity phosphatase PhoE